MTVTLSDRLKELFPNLQLVEDGDQLLCICRIDNKRCLNPSEASEDYSIMPGIDGDERVIRIFTTYSPMCKGCERNNG